jgi:ketol-acid reductoisomerase
VTPAEAVEEADVIVILAPDQVQRTLYKNEIEPGLTPGDTLVFGHGFNIRFGYITPPEGVDVFMVAPKGPGHLVRREYVDGRGVPVLVAVEKDEARATPGRSRCRTPRASVVCVPAASRPPSPRRPRPTCSVSRRCCAAAPRSWCMYGFETLIEAGYQPEVAYFECLHELKLIVDLMYEGGIAKQRWSVSDTAEYGDYVSGPRVIDP